MEKETLEEVALRIYQYVSENPPYTTITPKDKIEGFIEGAKWQQEQDKNKYSEEEVIKILDKREDYLGTEPSIFDYLTNKEWFEQFKKK